jgi:hypothetical protein
MLRRSLLALVVLAVCGSASQSGGPFHACHHCGCSKVRKVCCPVQEIVKETTFEYSCKCEDFCIPGRSKCVGTCCKPDCNGCCHREKVMQPTCGKVATKTVLVKTPVVKEKCVTKWVVKTVCCSCGKDCGPGCASGCADGSCTDANAAPTAAPVPPSPVKQASASKLLPGELFRLQ